MREIRQRLAQPLHLARCTLPHRIVRSATYEGMADAEGIPQAALGELYCALARDTPGTIVTGFCAVSREGRAMHPRQAAVWDDNLIRPWQAIVHTVRQASPGTRLFMQLAHAGRQTRKEMTGQRVVGASGVACTYFRQKVSALTEPDIFRIMADFGAAAYRAQQAGFDGVQLHAAHGYLIHQFLSPYTNTRADVWKDGGLLLRGVVDAVRVQCGQDFPLLLKISHSDDRGLTPEYLIPALRGVEAELDAVEVSYGTMEYALNIIRGGCPIDTVLNVNPLFNGIPKLLRTVWKQLVFPYKRRAFMPFTPRYNVDGALALKRTLSVPVIPVGGVHSLDDMGVCLNTRGFAAVSLCRPLVREPDLVTRLLQGQWTRSACTRCNLCTVYCDSPQSLRCYHQGAHHVV